MAALAGQQGEDDDGSEDLEGDGGEGSDDYPEDYEDLETSGPNFDDSGELE